MALIFCEYHKNSFLAISSIDMFGLFVIDVNEFKSSSWKNWKINGEVI